MPASCNSWTTEPGNMRILQVPESCLLSVSVVLLISFCKRRRRSEEYYIMIIIVQ